jgi:predicted PurR-regulated permease PerM
MAVKGTRVENRDAPRKLTAVKARLIARCDLRMLNTTYRESCLAMPPKDSTTAHRGRRVATFGPASTIATPEGPLERVVLVRGLALLAATLIGLYVCYLLALPFIPALAWALAMAVLAAPLHHRLERRLTHPTLAAAISVVLLALLVVMPLTLMAQQLSGVLRTGVASVQEQFASGDLKRSIHAYPLFVRVNDTIGGHMDFTTILANLGTWLTNLGALLVRESLANVITVLLAFYLLFFLLRDHREALLQAKMLSPLTDAETDYVFGRISDTIHAIIFGIAVTAAVQGAFGGLIFWLLGLPNPVFWGIVMALLSVFPFLGAFVVWIPAAIHLALSGAWGKAAILAAYGSIVIGGIDNILHPILAGGRLRLHTIAMFISIVGGLMLFGASGLILGPLAVTTTVAMLEIWRERAYAQATNR